MIIQKNKTLKKHPIPIKALSAFFYATIFLLHNTISFLTNNHLKISLFAAPNFFYVF